MSRAIDGKFSQRLNPARIDDGWHNRFSAEIMPLAQLSTTNGESFTMTFANLLELWIKTEHDIVWHSHRR